MKRRTVVRILSFLVVIALILVVVIFKCYKEMNFYKNQVRFTYSLALDELNTSIENININLEKAAYITTEKQINSIAVTLYTEAKIAKNAFSQISGVGLNRDGFNKFLSQVGNYAVFVAQKVTDGQQISEKDRENILKLGEISDKLSKDITDIGAEYNNSGFWSKELSNSVNSTLENSELNDFFSEIDENFTDYPTLIYDGPYSDYATNNEPQLLNDKEIIEVETAKNYAAKLLDIEASELSLDGSENGKIDAYRFIYKGGVISISLKGGYPVYFRKYTTEKTPFYNYEQAISIAYKYLSKNTSKKFMPTYYYTDNGVCTINFSYVNGTVICYTDLIKIGIDLSTGAVVLYEGRGYLTNHTVRTLPSPKYSLEEARQIVSPALSIKQSSMCVIPTASGEEVQCYEFLCEGENNREILVYINTQNLQEEELFIVLHTNGGTLVK